MSIDARVIADSISPDGVRLTTYEAVFPRWMLAEVNTHRVKSRNSASSRAIPTERNIERVLTDPFVPITFNKRVKGMGVGDELDTADQELARIAWLGARDAAANAAKILAHSKLDVDKSRANRLLEPFMWHTAIISATEWDNFFALRDHEAAQPEFQILAGHMRALYEANDPQPLGSDEWHLPFVSFAEMRERDGGDIDWAFWKDVSSRRVARVSFDKHTDSEPLDIAVTKTGELKINGHFSPLEQIARPISPKDIDNEEIVSKLHVDLGTMKHVVESSKPTALGLIDNIDKIWSGNFRGWWQYRKESPWEHNHALVPEQP